MSGLPCNTAVLLVLHFYDKRGERRCVREMRHTIFSNHFIEEASGRPARTWYVLRTLFSKSFAMESRRREPKSTASQLVLQLHCYQLQRGIISYQHGTGCRIQQSAHARPRAMMSTRSYSLLKVNRETYGL